LTAKERRKSRRREYMNKVRHMSTDINARFS
jgi:hypothetical protein